MNIWYWLAGWRKHISPYIEEAAQKRGVEVKTYRNGLLLMITYKERMMVFHAVPCNKWGDPPDNKIYYGDYIQEKVDEVTAIRWSYKYDGTD